MSPRGINQLMSVFLNFMDSQREKAERINRDIDIHRGAGRPAAAGKTVDAPQHIAGKTPPWAEGSFQPRRRAYETGKSG